MTSRNTLVFLVGFLLGPCLYAQPAQKPVSNEGATVWRELRTLRGHRSAIWCVAFSSDGKLLATSTRAICVLQASSRFGTWPVDAKLAVPVDVAQR